jgi:hypothetical protein
MIFKSLIYNIFWKRHSDEIQRLQDKINELLVKNEHMQNLNVNLHREFRHKLNAQEIKHHNQMLKLKGINELSINKLENEKLKFESENEIIKNKLFERENQKASYLDHYNKINVLYEQVSKNSFHISNNNKHFQNELKIKEFENTFLKIELDNKRDIIKEQKQKIKELKVIQEHDLTQLKKDEFEHLYKSANENCKSDDPKDILFEMLKILEDKIKGLL